MIAVALTLCGLVTVSLGILFILRGRDGAGYAFMAGGNLAVGIGDMAARNWILAVLSFACAVVCAWFWRRRKRRRSPKLAGAKSRALLAAVVARMRQSLKPRPVLRPVPGGAR